MSWDRRSGRALRFLALALPLSELGHFVAYGLRAPSGGAHGYFPFVLHVAGALVGAGLLAGLALVVLARLLGGAQARRRPWSFPLVFSALLLLQLAVFLAQEGLEARGLPGLPTLAAGLLAQQPVAFVAALAIRWLSARLGPAFEAIAGIRQPDLGLVTAFRGYAEPGVALGAVAASAPVLPLGSRAPPA